MLITQQELLQNQANNTQYLEQARIAAIKIIVTFKPRLWRLITPLKSPKLSLKLI